MIGAKASTTSKKIRASIAVVDASASITYTVPVAVISAIQLSISNAGLDTTNKNPYVNEIQIILDSVFLSTAKKLQDLVVPVDSVGKSLAKPATDIFSVSDTVRTLLIFIRKFSDATNTSDHVAISALKNIADSYALADSRSAAFNKLIPDGVAMQDGADIADGLVTNITKYIMNMAFTNDAKVIDYSKSVLDSFTQTDAKAIDFSRPVLDSFGLLDSNTIVTALAKAESLAAVDQIYLGLSKLISGDSVVFSEQIVNNLGKVLSDTAAPDDAGWLYAQNYCDITYFAEDYVGEYRTFT